MHTVLVLVPTLTLLSFLFDVSRARLALALAGLW